MPPNGSARVHASSEARASELRVWCANAYASARVSRADRADQNDNTLNVVVHYKFGHLYLEVVAAPAEQLLLHDERRLFVRTKFGADHRCRLGQWNERWRLRGTTS